MASRAHATSGPSRSAHLDATLVALADPTRRAILLRLSRGDARVTDLAAPFSISLNSVSKHIRLLERAQLVRRKRRGREHWLSRNAAPLVEAATWIETLREQWNARLDRLEAALEQDLADGIEGALHNDLTPEKP